MKLVFHRVFFKSLTLSIALAVFALRAAAGTLFVSLQSTNPVAPYADWDTAATNIQDAIDAASVGDLVLVTNGVYATGGKAMAGDLTNRVALYKAIKVQSVNGPVVTKIQGEGQPGPGAIRCAWLTNGAVLTGFRLSGGGTRSSGDLVTLRNGGGAWCASSNATIFNCLIIGNTASYGAGGCFQGTLLNCAVVENTAAGGPAGGAQNSLLINCTVTRNSAVSTGGGTALSSHTNCIIQFNTPTNYFNGTFSYCCTTPLPSGAGNTVAEPQLLVDNIHLSSTSLCRAAGTNLVAGTDIDGQGWANPPSIGCDEWQTEPIVISQPAFEFLTSPLALKITVNVAGQHPIVCRWFKDEVFLEEGPRYSGANTTTLIVSDPGPDDAGSYHMVASNSYGVTASQVSKLVLRFVDKAGSNPLPPYTNWTSAASVIQDAVDVADAGDFVFVTNGIYALGGKVMAGDLTNRVAVGKPITIQSVNGPLATIIQGGGATNGARAVRCVWLTNGASVIGFTLERGATRSTGDPFTLMSGGGVWCAAANSLIVNCIIRSNIAFSYGGGGYRGSYRNCAFVGNSLQSPVISGGGGCYQGSLSSCTLSGNSSVGAYQCALTNCIAYYNTPGDLAGSSAYYSYSCSPLLPTTSGNLTNAPELLADGFHLSSTSPCRAAGTNLVAGADIDGQPWESVPSMGCDQWQPAPLAIFAPVVRLSNDFQGFSIRFDIAGQGPFICWWTRNGTPIEDDGHFSFSHTTNLVANGVIWLDGGSYQVVASNAFGMVTSVVAQLVFHYVDRSNPSPMPPYTSWETAATNIQDAIDVAMPGEPVFVTNGVYDAGGKVMAGDLTNRVALDKPLLLKSVNGAASTIIQGNLAATNGPLAVRCAWLTNGAALHGFTLRHGATRTNGDLYIMGSGGGVWCGGTDAAVANCIVANNNAQYAGGGCYRGSLKNCFITGNYATTMGGGVANSTLTGCAITKNTALEKGCGAYGGTLVNCTITGNRGGLSTICYGGGAWGASLINCLLSANWVSIGLNGSNYSSCTMSYCFTAPLPSGSGNLTGDPQLLSDGIHLATASPCRGFGTNVAAMGVDIDGQAWSNPPSIGCDEWQPTPTVCIQPNAQSATAIDEIHFGGVEAAGQQPFTYFWSKDDVLLQDGGKYDLTSASNLVIHAFDPSDAGVYHVVVSNSAGVATSQVSQVVIHCVNPAVETPAPPYSTWASASMDIQSAIDAAAPGEFVLVTNGLYCTGGRVASGSTTNRIVLDKRLTVMSVNGPSKTVIEGAWDPATTNGPASVRCAWLTNSAVLNGFSLRGGSTGASDSGGGVWSVDTPLPGVVMNCLITSNTAGYSGGGIYRGNANNCVISGNRAQYGGGEASAFLYSCFAQGNSAANSGGGGYYGFLGNCTVIGNTAAQSGGGAYNAVYECRTVNSIIYFNSSPKGPDLCTDGGLPCPNANCCTPSTIRGTLTVTADPQLVDGMHLATTSPCRSAGFSGSFSPSDIDGELWLSPPSIGCDEVVESSVVGSLEVAIEAPQTELLVNRSLALTGLINGRAARLEWSFGDGPSVTNASFITSHTWSSSGDYTVTLTAYNGDNPMGVSSTRLVHVLPVVQPLLSSASMTTNGLEFQFEDQAGVNYVVEQATNLAPPIAWMPARTNVGTGGGIRITNTVSTNEATFYRMRAW